MKLNGTKTERNLRRAFENESKAAMKYFHFADEAEEEVIEQLFLQVMKNEQEHAEIFAEYLGLIGDTKENLMSSISAESLESKIDYPEMAMVARGEGFDEIATKFELIGRIEQMHKERFEEYLRKIGDGSLYKQQKNVSWVCMKCGHIHQGLEPPTECPVCGHSAQNFKMI